MMNQLSKPRFVRWLSTIASAACVGSLLSFGSLAVGQLPTPIGSGVENSAHSHVPTRDSQVQYAVPIVSQSDMENRVAHATGQAMPPILTPSQAAPEKQPSMLSPLPANKAAVRDGNVAQATAQWPVQNRPYRVAQGSGSRNMPVQIAPMEPTAVAPGPGAMSYGPTANPLPPIIENNSMAPPAMSSPQEFVPQSSTLVGDNGYNTQSPVMQAPSAMQTPSVMMPEAMSTTQAAPTYFDQQSMPSAPVYDASPTASCSSCGSGSCGGGCGADSSCGSCGPNGCFNPSAVAERFGCAGSVSCARRYVMADALWITRGDSDFGGTNRGNLGDYDHDIGWRVTVGRRWDVTAGDELTYMGTTELERRRETTSASNSLQAAFGVNGGFGPAESSTFFNASRQIEFTSTQLHSVEYNRAKWSWDVVKTHWGIRGIYADDEYALFSENGTGAGSLRLQASNFLLGPQIGGELFYDVGYRLSFSALGKAGVFLNVLELDTDLNNNSTPIISRNSDDIDISTAIELGGIAHYQLSPKVRLRGGYNFLWLFDVATATDAFPTFLNGAVGQNVTSRDDMLFHGVSAGIEIFR